jgi:hypothetical protein
MPEACLQKARLQSHAEDVLAESYLDSHACHLCSKGGRWRHSVGAAAALDFAVLSRRLSG